MVQANYVSHKMQDYLRGTNKTLNAAAMEFAVARLRKTLEGQFSSEREGRNSNTLKLYPSEAGKCERAILYKALGIPGEPMGGDVRFKMAMGDLLEMAVMYVAMHTPDVTIIENNKIRDITIGGIPWRGATDGILVSGQERRNFEVKSASGIGFKMTVQKGIDDNFGYLTQAGVYMRQLLADGVINLPETVFLYVDRDSMKMAEIVVRYDEELAKRADEKFERVRLAWEKKKVLARPYEVKPDGSLPLQCSYCSHKHTCYVSPRQVVTFDPGPVYRIDPVEQLSMVMRGNKPVWLVSRKPQKELPFDSGKTPGDAEG